MPKRHDPDDDEATDWVIKITISIIIFLVAFIFAVLGVQNGWFR